MSKRRFRCHVQGSGENGLVIVNVMVQLTMLIFNTGLLCELQLCTFKPV